MIFLSLSPFGLCVCHFVFHLLMVLLAMLLFQPLSTYHSMISWNIKMAECPKRYDNVIRLDPTYELWEYELKTIYIPVSGKMSAVGFLVPLPIAIHYVNTWLLSNHLVLLPLWEMSLPISVSSSKLETNNKNATISLLHKWTCSVINHELVPISLTDSKYTTQ